MKPGNLFLKLHVSLVYAFLYAPILVLIVFSFNQEKINVVWSGFTLDWYRKLLSNVELLTAFQHSVTIAGAVTVVSTLIGTLLAFGMVRYKFPGKNALDALLHLPIIIPDIVIAISMLSYYVLIKMTLGLLTIAIAHVSFCVAFVTVVVRARLIGFDKNLELAAMDLGATPWRTFRYVTLPLIMPGVVAGGLMAFTLSWDDFLIAFFTSGVGATTLPLKVYSMIKFGVSPEINAISTLTILVTVMLILTAMRLQRDAVAS